MSLPVKQETGSEFNELIRDIRQAILKADQWNYAWWRFLRSNNGDLKAKLLRFAELIPETDETVAWLLEFQCPCVCHRSDLEHICPCENGINSGGSRASKVP